MSNPTAALKRDLDIQIARENITWWENLREEHRRKGEIIGVRRCQEEIDLWQKEINDAQ